MAGVPPKAADVQDTLNRIACFLERLAGGPDATPGQRKQCTLYAPFARELAKRKGFCVELANINIHEQMYLGDIGVALRPLLDKYRFPLLPRFALNNWAEMLTCARFGSDYFVPRCFFRFPVQLEVQFQHQREARAEHGDSNDVPIRSVKLSMPQEAGREQLRAFLSRGIVGNLGRLRREVLSRAKPQSDFTVIVRLIIPEMKRRRGSQTAGAGSGALDFNFRETIVQSFQVEFRNGRNNIGTAKRITESLSPWIEPLVGSTVAPGRRYNAEVRARWWAMRRLDGMTVRKIADQESIDYSSQVDDETVRKALKRMGC